ncbi:unnamed protein product, partial [Gadus morhua 'NCC']
MAGLDGLRVLLLLAGLVAMANCAKNIASLYARMVVTPVHTADCERALSTLKRVKKRLVMLL